MIADRARTCGLTAFPENTDAAGCEPTASSDRTETAWKQNGTSMSSITCPTHTAPPAPAASTPPIAVWETASLDPDCPLVFKGYDGIVRAAYDPQQVDQDEARQLLRTFYGTFREIEAPSPALARYAASRCPEPATPEQVAAWERAKGLILGHPDPRSAAVQTAELFRREQAVRDAEEECAR